MKKIFSILLATALVLSLCVTSFAAPVIKYIYTDEANNKTYFFCSYTTGTDLDAGIKILKEFDYIPTFLNDYRVPKEEIITLSLLDKTSTIEKAGGYVTGLTHEDVFANAKARPFGIGLQTNTKQFMVQGYCITKDNQHSQTYGTFPFDAETMTDNYRVEYGNNNLYLKKAETVEAYDTIAERPIASYGIDYENLEPFTPGTNMGTIRIFAGGVQNNTKNYVNTMALVKLTMPADADKGVAYMHFKGAKGGNWGLNGDYKADVEVYDVTDKVTWADLTLEGLKDTSIVEGLEPLFEVNIDKSVDAMIEIPAGKLTAGERIFAYKFKENPKNGYINASIDTGRSSQTALYSTHLIPMGE